MTGEENIKKSVGIMRDLKENAAGFATAGLNLVPYPFATQNENDNGYSSEEYYGGGGGGGEEEEEGDYAPGAGYESE